ncbi:MAG: hypothetical protein E6G44_10380 [Actinobacteria bacterium]|nr:MAG: hypothetical protein E6G44_10380 [Actinomycetota bacterium]
MDRFDLNSKLFWWTLRRRDAPDDWAEGRRLLSPIAIAALGVVGAGLIALGVIAWLTFPYPGVGVPIGLLGLGLLWMAASAGWERHLFPSGPGPGP